MSAPRTGFSEVTAERRTVQVPLSHASIELGHLYMEDFSRGPDFLRAQFERVRPWADVAKQVLPGRVPKSKPRVSMCFMIDDYFARFESPSKVIPELHAAAKEAGLTIDYLARESGCAEAYGVRLPELVQGRLVADPPPGTTGARRPVGETGWLCNGQRSPVSEATEALREVPRWQAPVQNGARNHSVFIDVELWDQHGAGQQRRWSCSFLAAVWQLLRLGLLRHEGRPVMTPVQCPEEFPDDWDELPPLIRLNPNAHPFSAYQTLSIIDADFLPIEAAVRTILAQVHIDGAAERHVLERSQAEGMPLAGEVVDRISYVFLTGNPTG